MALSKCLDQQRLLDHFMVDNTGATVPLAPKTTNFTSDPPNLRALFDVELNRQRPNESALTNLGMNSIADLATSPHSLKLALIDVTGATKLAAPEFVSNHTDTDRIAAASLGKIAAIYAAHQLKFDVQTKIGKSTGIASSDLKQAFTQLRQQWSSKKIPTTELHGQPQLEKILTVSNGQLTFEQEFANRMQDITSSTSGSVMNAGAGFLFKSIGYPYVASALLQSGLCDRNNGGLFVSWGYSAAKWQCGTDGLVKLGSFWQEITLTAAATYLTLLAQRNLISGPASDEIKNVLHGKPIDEHYAKQYHAADWQTWMGVYTGGDIGTLMDVLPGILNVSPSTVNVYGKHGLLESVPGFAHEAVLVERDAGSRQLRYIVICLVKTETLKEVSQPNYPLLDTIVKVVIPAMDFAIQTNN